MKLTQTFIAPLLTPLLKLALFFFHRIDKKGIENIPAKGALLLLGNHTSLIDWAIVQASCPRRIHFVIPRSKYEKWPIKLCLNYFDTIEVTQDNPEHITHEIKRILANGEVVCFFPEIYPSKNGHLGEFDRRFESAGQETKAPIIPFYIRGLWGSPTSFVDQHYRLANNLSERKISIDFGAPLPSHTSTPMIKQAIMEISVQAWIRDGKNSPSIPEQWLKSAKKFKNAISVSDSSGAFLTHYKFIAAVMFFRAEFKRLTHGEQNIGIILPPSCAGAFTNMAILCLGKAVVNLNYSSTPEAIAQAIQKADIKTVITSKKFIAALETKGFHLAPILKTVKPLYLDVYKKPSTKIRMLGHLLTGMILPRFILKKFIIKPVSIEDTAAILFSSGSEGTPKGVELSHFNMLSNIKQFSTLLNVEDEEIMLNNLPLFHAFGLTCSVIFPLVEGMRFVCHPDPTDAVSIGKLVYQYNIRMMFGTSTLYNLYCRNKHLHPIMFKSLRLVVAGAEKLAPAVKANFKEKFGIDICEGYGTTELSPVSSSNIPDVLCRESFELQVGHKDGSVGQPLPGTAYRIIHPDTQKECAIGEDGLILVGGPQVMKGFLKDPQKTASVILNASGIRWYMTGDKGHLDEDRYLSIVDRYSRFAKVGGEMVGLSAVENAIRSALNNPEIELMVTAIPDLKRGERLVLLHSNTIESAKLKEIAKNAGLSNYMQPQDYLPLAELPKLGSGKADYGSGKKIAMENCK